MAEKLRTLDFGDGKGARVLVPDWENVDNKPFGEVITTLIDNQTVVLGDLMGTGMLMGGNSSNRTYR